MGSLGLEGVHGQVGHHVPVGLHLQAALRHRQRRRVGGGARQLRLRWCGVVLEHMLQLRRRPGHARRLARTSDIREGALDAHRHHRLEEAG